MITAFKSFCVVVLMLTLLTPCASWGEDMKVLLLRPEKLTQTRIVQLPVSDLGDRDPFTWSQEIVQEFTSESLEDIEKLFSGYILQGVLWDEESPMAVINEQTLQAGDEILGALITRIEKDNVTLHKDGHTHHLQFATTYYELKDK